jgi:hypothetical protein
MKIITLCLECNCSNASKGCSGGEQIIRWGWKQEILSLEVTRTSVRVRELLGRASSIDRLDSTFLEGFT